MFVPNPVHLEMDLSLVAYIVMPLLMKILLDVSHRCLARYYAYAKQRELPCRKAGKLAVYLLKIGVYFVSWLIILPQFVSLLKEQFNTDPPQILHAPFSDGMKNYRYLKLNLSMVTGLYVMEVIAVPGLEFIVLLHHYAIVFAVCCFSGAIPWLSMGDLELMAGSAIIVWCFQSMNFMGYLALARYHLSFCPRVQQKCMQFCVVQAMLHCCCLRPAVAWVWVYLKWDQYQSWAPIAVTLAVDAAITLENVHTTYVFDRIRRKCSKKIQEKDEAAKQATAAPAVEGMTSGDKSDVPGIV
jgi:hypothetical protein